MHRYSCFRFHIRLFLPLTQVEEKIRLFYRAAENQTDVMIKNILGQGIDIHLLGLRQLARQSDCAEALAVFEDPSYGIINHFALSTSQVTSHCVSFLFLSLLPKKRETKAKANKGLGEK